MQPSIEKDDNRDELFLKGDGTDRPETSDTTNQDRFIRSKNLTTARNIKKLIDKNQNRIEAYKKDFVERTGNVENNLIKSK